MVVFVEKVLIFLPVMNEGTFSQHPLLLEN